MNRKRWLSIGGIALAILVVGIVSWADTLNVLEFTLEDDTVNGVAAWDTTEKHLGSSSVRLLNPGGADDYAEAYFALPGNVTLAEIVLATTSFWCKSAVGANIPYFIFEIVDGSLPGVGAERLRINNDAAASAGYAAWTEFVASSTTPLWQWEILDAGWNTLDSGWDTWDDLVVLYGTLVVDGVLVELSGLAGAITAYVDDITVNGTTYYGLIQDAIGTALAGDTIEVADGTYTEGQFDIAQEVTLVSTNGAASTTIKVDQYGVCVIADNVTIGQAGQGFTFTPDANPTTTCIGLLRVGYSTTNTVHNVDNVSIEDNIFEDFVTSQDTEHHHGVAVGPGGVTNVDVLDNLFRNLESTATGAGAGMSGIVVFRDGATPQGITISGNTLYDITQTTGIVVEGAISIQGGAAGSGNGIVVEDNTIYNIAGAVLPNGIVIHNPSVNVQNHGNEIHDVAYAGILISDSVTDVQIFGDEIYNNPVGVRLLGSGGQVTIRFNEIYDNTTGVVNDAAPTVDATDNWWGDTTGPYNATTNTAGLGNAVSDNVDYTPWIQSTVTETTTETVTNGTVTLPGVGGAAVTGTAEVTVGKYDGNPSGSGFGSGEIGYIDVYVPDTSAVTEIEIRMVYPAGTDTATLKLHWYNGTAWVECSIQGVNIGLGYVWATITATTTPNLTQLQGTIFGGGSNLPASAFWFEDFEYTDQAAMETAGWVFGANAEQLWHLTAESAVPALAYPNLVAFPSSNHAVWFGKPISGSYGPTSVSSKAVSPEARAQRTRIQPMGAGGGYPYGELTSPAIDVTGQSSVMVSFDYFREVEYYYQGTYDKTYVQVQFGGGAWQTIWNRDSTWSSELVWIPASIDGLPVWYEYWIPVAVPSGATNMKIRFVFDAVDNVANDYLGWLIDDLMVSSTSPAGLRFEEESLPEGLLDQAYSATIHAVGGTVSGTYAWRVISNTADSWLTVTLGATTATLSGTPTVAGTYQLCIGVSDDRGQTYSRCYDIIIEQLIAGGDLFYDDFESVDGWTTTGLWHRTENTPCVDPSYASPTHVYYYGKDATCNYATSGANSGTLTSPAIDVSGLAPGSQLTIGWKYWREVELYLNGAFDQSSVEISFDGGTGWTQIWYDDSKQNELMGGWHLVEATQSTVGAATIVVPVGATSLLVRFRFVTGDGYANNYVGWLIDDVKVIQQVAGVSSLDITSICDDLPDGQVNVAYNAQLTATGGVLPYTWTWTVGPIPGLTVNPSTGAIAGTPTAAGTYQCTFQVADNVGFTVVLGPCEIVIAPAPPCPCDLAAIDFENGAGGSLVDDVLAPALWTVTNLWHLAGIGGCVTCPEIIDHYAYFGIDASCTFNTGVRVAGYLTSPVIAVDPCISEVAIGFDHFREVEFLATGTFDQTTVQVRWDGGAWQTVWMRHSANPSPNCEQLAIGPIPVAGAQLEVRFGFDSVDKLFNNFIGWALDHVWVKDYACAGGPFVSPLRVLWAKDEARDEFTVLNIPNPVRDVHTTTFSVRGEGIEAIRIQIFDVDQQLMYEEEVDGEDLVWHTVNNYGEYLANGVYFYRALVKKGGIWLTTPFEKLVILR